MADTLVTIRPIKPDEHGFVLASLPQSMRSSQYASGCPSDTLHPALYRAAKTLLSSWTVLVADSVDVPGELAGWVAYRITDHAIEVAYVYVKQAFRGLGIGTTLLECAGAVPGVPFRLVFGRPDAVSAFKTKGYRPLFTPFLALELTHENEQDRPN